MNAGWMPALDSSWLGFAHGASYERFVEAVGGHARACILYDPSHFVLQQLDYLAFLACYHPRIPAFHVKNAEFRPKGRSGVFGGYQNWTDRPGRFRSLATARSTSAPILRFAQYNYPGCAVLEWDCALKQSEYGAKEGAPFIRNHISRVTERPFDDFAASGMIQR